MTVPVAPEESGNNRPIIFMSEDDGVSALRATLLSTHTSAIVQGERLGVLAVGTADGNDTTQGALADAAVITDASGSVSAKLRGLVKWAFERMPQALGQVVKSASLPVTMASDQEPTNVNVYNVPLTVADTEYNQAVTAGTKHITFQCRTAFDVRCAWETGKVAAPTAPYQTLKSGNVRTILSVGSGGKTLYFASAQAGVVVEIETWS